MKEAIYSDIGRSMDDTRKSQILELSNLRQKLDSLSPGLTDKRRQRMQLEVAILEVLLTQNCIVPWVLKSVPARSYYKVPRGFSDIVSPSDYKAVFSSKANQKKRDSIPSLVAV